MRKRDKKREKAKAEARDKKRKEVYVDVEIGEGGKRGAGHRQRVSLSLFRLSLHPQLHFPKHAPRSHSSRACPNGTLGD